MKVPPRTVFFGQAIASLWACVVQVSVLYWAFGNIKGICEEDQSARFTCPNGRVFFTASIIWGVIGPGRIFSKVGIYGQLQYFWLIGALLPIVFYFMAKKWRKGPFKFLHAPIIFGGTSYIPPATPLIYLSWGFVSFTSPIILSGTNGIPRSVSSSRKSSAIDIAAGGKLTTMSPLQHSTLV